MLRTLLYLLLAILAITVLRSVIGIVMKAASHWLSGPSSPAVREEPGHSVPTAGVLRKDPVCGTFVSEAIAVKLKTRSGTLHFCSEACRDKYLQTTSAE